MAESFDERIARLEQIVESWNISASQQQWNEFLSALDEPAQDNEQLRELLSLPLDERIERLERIVANDRLQKPS